MRSPIRALGLTGAYMRMSSTMSTVVPVCIAAPWAISAKVRCIASSCSFVAARRPMSHSASSGMMFCAAPPLVMIPCTRVSAGRCCRHPSIATNSRIAAESALRPRCGENAACAATPWKVTRFVTTPSELPPNSQSGSPDGWDDSTATESRKTPASMRSILPPPLSSAGVPISSTPTLSSFARSAASRNAPTFDIAMRLCPQACPISGSASYSASRAIAGPAGPTRARKAVSTPPSFCSTL